MDEACLSVGEDRPASVAAVTSGKGGVGKTTSGIEISIQAGKKGHKSLLCDLDPQGNASDFLFGRELNASDLTVKNLLEEQFEDYKGPLTPIAKVVRKTRFQNVDVLPSSPGLGATARQLSSQIGWLDFVINIIKPLKPYYHSIIIDTPFGIGDLTRMAMKASSKVLIPTDDSTYSVKGIRLILATINLFKEKMGHEIEPKIFMTVTQKENSIAYKDAVKDIESKFDCWADVKIPHCTKVSQGQRYKKDNSEGSRKITKLDVEGPLPVCLMTPNSSVKKFNNGYSELAQLVLGGR